MEAFREAAEHGRTPEPGHPFLRLARGDAQGAWTSLRRVLADETMGLAARTTFLPAGVDMERFRPSGKESAKRPWGLSGNVLLYAGRLEPEKRVGDIIHAFSNIPGPDATLVIAGDGRDRLGLERAAAGLNVRFLGTVAHDKMIDLLNAADALVLYSSREALPMVVLEALACNVPVISSPVGEIPQVIRNGVNGVLAQDLASLTDAMRSVASGASPLRGSPRDSVLGYSVLEMGSRLLRVYQGIDSSPRIVAASSGPH